MDALATEVASGRIWCIIARRRAICKVVACSPTGALRKEFDTAPSNEAAWISGTKTGRLPNPLPDLRRCGSPLFS